MAQGFTSPNARANLATFTALRFTVATAGTPVQLSNTPVPDGFDALVKMDTGQSGSVFVANSSANALLAANRWELKKGDAVSLGVNNLNAIWINSTNNNRDVFVIFES